ncbi:hypothetical protein KUCAC02_014634, partial [Chaenocephalus aceratus]
DVLLPRFVYGWKGWRKAGRLGGEGGAEVGGGGRIGNDVIPFIPANKTEWP